MVEFFFFSQAPTTVENLYTSLKKADLGENKKKKVRAKTDFWQKKNGTRYPITISVQQISL